jgi:hypothetical protein
MKKFESTNGKYTHFCCETIVLSNYLHKHHMDFTYEVIGNQIQDLANWVLIATNITTLRPWL